MSKPLKEFEYWTERKSYRDMGDAALEAVAPQPGDRLIAATLSGNTVIYWWEREKKPCPMCGSLESCIHSPKETR